jgi:hypothetical protein
MATPATTKRKAGHCVMGNNEMLCTHCGRKQPLPMPMDIDMFAAMAKQFEKSHKNCEKRWEPPKPDMSQTMEQRIQWWWQQGERGISSETLLMLTTSRHERPYMEAKRMDHPYDPDDFRRCYLLLQAVPELRSRFHRVKPTPVWTDLVEHWDELTAMLEEQLRTRKANGMYERMKELGC